MPPTHTDRERGKPNGVVDDNDVEKLADDALVWSDETLNSHRPYKLADQLRVRWATDYHLAGKHQQSAATIDPPQEASTL